MQDRVVGDFQGRTMVVLLAGSAWPCLGGFGGKKDLEGSGSLVGLGLAGRVVRASFPGL